MTVCYVRLMPGFLMIPCFMVVGSGSMMFCGVLMMLGGLSMMLCELSVAVRRLQAVALGDPVMPVVDGFFG